MEATGIVSASLSNGVSPLSCDDYLGASNQSATCILHRSPESARFRCRFGQCDAGDNAHEKNNRIKPRILHLSVAALQHWSRFVLFGRDLFRKAYSKDRPSTVFTIHFNCSAMCFHGPFDNRESQPRSAFLASARFVDSIE